MEGERRGREAEAEGNEVGGMKHVALSLIFTARLLFPLILYIT